MDDILPCQASSSQIWIHLSPPWIHIDLKKKVKSTFFPVLQIYKLDGADNFKTLAIKINVRSPLFKCLEFNHSKCRVKTQIVN